MAVKAAGRPAEGEVSPIGGQGEKGPSHDHDQGVLPTCGAVELTPADVAPRVCSHAPLSYYAFECATCGCEVRKPADEHVVSLLVSGGVPAQVWELPEEVLEARDGPRLTYDDLLDFALHLGASDLLASFAGAAVA